MFLEVELDPMFLEVGPETTIDLVTGLPGVGVLIHIIMILLHREGRVMTVGMVFHTEAGDLKGTEVIMARPAANHVNAVKGQIMPPARVGRKPLFLASRYPPINPAVKLTSFFRQSQTIT